MQGTGLNRNLADSTLSRAVDAGPVERVRQGLYRLAPPQRPRGVNYHLTKGDVITIPTKTPHQWKDTSKTGSVGYYAVNFDSN
jgi:hypothetical protein